MIFCFVEGSAKGSATKRKFMHVTNSPFAGPILFWNRADNNSVLGTRSSHVEIKQSEVVKEQVACFSV